MSPTVSASGRFAWNAGQALRRSLPPAAFAVLPGLILVAIYPSASARAPLLAGALFAVASAVCLVSGAANAKGAPPAPLPPGARWAMLIEKANTLEQVGHALARSAAILLGLGAGIALGLQIHL